MKNACLCSKRYQIYQSEAFLLPPLFHLPNCHCNTNQIAPIFQFHFEDYSVPVPHISRVAYQKRVNDDQNYHV